MVLEPNFLTYHHWMSGSIGVSPSHRSSVQRGVELEQSGHPEHCHQDHWDDAGDGQQEGHHQDPGRVSQLLRFCLKYGLNY